MIIGQDVADRLAEDYIAGGAKAARARAKHQREADKAAANSKPVEVAHGSGEAPETPEARQAREHARAVAQRAAEREQRDAAVRFNLELGLLAFKHLPKIKVDERVLRILASVDIGSDLKGIAARGARLTMPGWATETQQKNGKTKMVYLDPWATERKANGFLAGAKTTVEIAGRALTLIALASLANEEALARSNRSFYEISFSGPWAVQAKHDMNAIVRGRIKEGQLEMLDEILTERLAHDENDLRDEEESIDARLRLEDVAQRLGELTDEQLDGALKDTQLACGKHAIETFTLKSRSRLSAQSV